MKLTALKSTAFVLMTAAALAVGMGCEDQQALDVQPQRHETPAVGYHEASYAATCGTGKTVATREPGSIVDVAAGTGQFNTLLKAAGEADLAETLANDGPFTLFAPTDAAFANLPHGTLDSLLADKEQLRAVLLYHVLPGRVTSAQITQRIDAKTAQGAALEVRPAHGTVAVGPNAVVTDADVPASNGVIHVIDNVLIPPK
ncbi:MAG: fasciclin domain-containing protein [Planctomycetes bacterium]|jgi:uncharacterized surface protein with fasciclin (FAS1) repeats|nr:fasciclin domain-containing protein [Planctomycetota bacterium]